MNNTENWFGGGCGFVGITRQPIYDKMQEYLESRKLLNVELNKRFPHNSEYNEKYNDRLDPLVVPIVDMFNLLGIETICSCQGNEYQSPYIFFYGELHHIAILRTLLLKHYRTENSGYFWTIAAIIHESIRDNRHTWILNFYDTLEMLNISKNAFNCNIDKFRIDYPEFK